MYKFILLFAYVLLMTQVDFCVFSQERENIRVTQLKADVEDYPQEYRASVVVRGDYNVVFYMDGVEVGRQVVAFNDRIKAPTYATERAGRKFLGWYDKNSNSLFDLNGYIRKDYAVEARWECINSYTVSFATDGGVFSNTADYTQTLCYRQTTLRPTNPTKVGYNFIDWYTNSNLTSVYDFSTAVTADITLYAKWEIKRYSVTLRYNGGGIDKTYTVNHGATVPISPEPYRYKVDGKIYTFKGWYTESYFINGHNVNSAVTSDLTLYAKWEVDPVYARISYMNAYSQSLSEYTDGYSRNPLVVALKRWFGSRYTSTLSNSHALVCVRYVNYAIATVTVVDRADRSTRAVFDIRNNPTNSAAILLPSSHYSNGGYEVIVNTEGGEYTQVIRRLYTSPQIIPDNVYDGSYSVNGQRKPMPPLLDILEVFKLDDATPLFYAMPPLMSEKPVKTTYEKLPTRSEKPVKEPVEEGSAGAPVEEGSAEEPVKKTRKKLLIMADGSVEELVEEEPVEEGSAEEPVKKTRKKLLKNQLKNHSTPFR